jgi:phosphoglucomutase
MEIISSVDDYLHLMKQLFDFSQLKQFTSRSDFRMLLDSMNGVTGIYTRRIFVEELGLPKEYLMRDIPKEDFGGHHPDPNLVYAHDLVELCDPKNKNKQAVPNFAAAFDGDGDRCMILGTGYVVVKSHPPMFWFA